MKKNKLAKILLVVCVAAMMCVMFAGCMPTGAASGGSDGSTGASYSYIIMLVLLFVVFYFFLIRPENKKKKKLQEMRSSLAVGDEITTIGGIIGKIVSIKDDTITFETGEDRVRMQVTKWAISTTGKSTDQN